MDRFVKFILIFMFVFMFFNLVRATMQISTQNMMLLKQDAEILALKTENNQLWRELTNNDSGN